MAHKIVFLDRDTIRRDISIRRPDFDHEWVEFPATTADQVIKRLQGADIAITNKVPLDADILTQLADLKLIAVAATGVDMIDLDACKARDITVCNIRDYALTTVPEHAIGLMLSLRRQVLRYRDEVIRGRWQEQDNFCFYDQPIHDVSGATLGIIGFGAIGQATAKLAHRLGMHIQYYSRTQKDTDYARPVDFLTLLETSDIISCHCALTPETHHLLSEGAFDKMKPSAILINTARGAVVDEAALAYAIEHQQIAAAGIDVLPQEPPAADSPMMKLASQSNVILTPHIAWASQQAMQILVDQLIENIERFQSGTPRHTV